jgi:3-dehydroquinate synthase
VTFDMGGGDSGRQALQRVTVAFEYPLIFTRRCFEPGNSALVDAVKRLEPARRHKLAVVVDGGVSAKWPDLQHDIRRYADAWPDHLDLVAGPLVIDGGEAAKLDPALQEWLLSWMCGLKLDRQSVLVIIGGGAVLDAVGYAGAVFHRGLRVVRVPTTVLSQDDSGVGVKNGINAFGIKNAVGTFAPPFAVINDTAFLDTLDRRDRIAGMAEAVKVAAIRDAGFFVWLEEQIDRLTAFEADAVEILVRRSAELHLRHIATAGDPFEFGSARPLDFGHWAAHKLESLTRSALRHGEAVAIGMGIDAIYSYEVGLLGQRDRDRLCGVLEGLGLGLHHPALDERDGEGERRVLEGIEEFREHLGGELTVTMLSGIGRGVEVHEIDRAAMERAIQAVARRSAVSCA